MPVYRTKGTLTGTIEPENVAAAQAYLLYDPDNKPINMHQYLDQPLDTAVELLEWTLFSDGHHYHVTAITNRELTEDELRVLSLEVSGQNSDGLGEGFEQQEFAELEGEGEVDCFNCDGSGDDCQTCDGAGFLESEEYTMISFDWKTNELPWERIS